MVPAQPHGRPYPLVGVGRRHPYVRDHHIRQRALIRQVAHGLDQRFPVTDTGDHVVPAVGQQPGQALPKQH